MVKRGDIILVSLDPVLGSEQGKTRPAVVIQHDALNKTSNTTIIVPITSKIYDKEYPMHVQIYREKIKGTIKTEQIRAIDMQRIVKVIDSVDNKTLLRIGYALKNTCNF